MPKKKLKWNLGKGRVEHISNLLEQVRVGYIQARQNPDKDSVQDYAVLLDSLFLEVETYIKGEDEDQADEIDKKLDRILNDLEEEGNGFDDFQLRDYLKRLRGIERVLNRLRIEAGLDIPRSTEFDEEKAAVQGLR